MDTNDMTNEEADLYILAYIKRNPQSVATKVAKDVRADKGWNRRSTEQDSADDVRQGGESRYTAYGSGPLNRA